MTYSSNIQEVQQPAFTELYLFESGDDSYRYNSLDKPVNFLGEYYEPGLIKRSGLSYDKTFSAISLTISARMSDPLQAYIANFPIKLVRIIVYRAFLEDLTDYITLFKGIIKKITIKDKMISANCETLSGIFRKKLPCILYQSYCNNNLFDDTCALTEATYKVTASATESGNDLNSATFGGYADGYFTGGYVELDDDIKLITNHVGNDITLQIPFSSFSSPSSVDAYPGCDKAPDTCKNKFSNFDNFVGFPYVPSKNPCLYGIR